MGEVEEEKLVLIFCYVFRRVDEFFFLLVVFKFGFKFVDRWVMNLKEFFVGNIVDCWFYENDLVVEILSLVLYIFYF